MMQVTYTDGKRERHDDMSATDLTAAFHRIAALADEIVSVQVLRAPDDELKPAGPYPNNRQGRRRWARELRSKR